MGINLTVQFNNFGAMGAQLENRASQVVRKSATDIEANWKTNIETAGLIDTGAYLNSVQAQEESATHWEVSTNLSDPPYPVFLEYGTVRGIKPYGVMTSAVEMVSPAFYEAIRQLMQMGR